jgi:hypothetical protein
VHHARKSIRFFWHGMGLEIYVATPENFAIMWLIRTGPAEQNRALAVRAKKQGKKLAFARGIEQKSTGKVLTFDTEEEVLSALWLPYCAPTARDHPDWIGLIQSGRRVKPGGEWVLGGDGLEERVGEFVKAAEEREQRRAAMSDVERVELARKSKEELYGI